MTYVTQLADGPTELDRVWRLRPKYYDLFMEDYHRSIGRLEPVLIEVCRLWMATLLGSKLDLSLRYKRALEAGLTETKIKELANYAKSPLFTAQEKACLDFTEQFAIQSSNITDDDVKRLSGVLSWEDVIYFIKALNVLEQLSRSSTVLDIQASNVAPSPMAGQFQVASSHAH